MYCVKILYPVSGPCEKQCKGWESSATYFSLPSASLHLPDKVRLFNPVTAMHACTLGNEMQNLKLFTFIVVLLSFGAEAGI